MDALYNKFGDDATVIVQAFNILDNRNRDEELSFANKGILKSAADDIVFVLGGLDGLTFIEFEVLVGYATLIDPTEQLPFLDKLVDIVRASRQVASFTEYDYHLFDFIEGIHTGLARAEGDNLGLYISPPLADTNVGQQVDYQEMVPENDMPQIESVGSSRMWRYEAEEVSDAGTYTHSAVWTVTGSILGGSYTTAMMTSTTFTPSNVPTSDSTFMPISFGEPVGILVEPFPSIRVEEGLVMPFEGLQIGIPEDSNSSEAQEPLCYPQGLECTFNGVF
ncbi:hypothetical protein FBEOM_13430 [Fusarium beomiforme]|uniref:Uncharacterized protein n=1 Tax=Fusarium beomiforme TaxID=44412 RepID=A0A9P5A5S3_9HYPO|nr:hypothetical protein FBEOM_13430 [Fusarium beomiforme]